GVVRLVAYRGEWVVLALVALAALTVVNAAGPQDDTRVMLTRSIVHGKLTVPASLFDRAVYGGRSYSDKAPGMSVLAVPAYALERAGGVDPRPRHWDGRHALRLWLLRAGSGGLLFLLGVFLVGRAAEGLAAGTGAVDAATFGSPLHLSYRYVANQYAERQHGGFFGIGVPTAHGLKEVVVGDRGLLPLSPVLVLAAFGLWLLWRRGLRAEALVAAFVTV